MSFEFIANSRTHAHEYIYAGVKHRAGVGS